MSRRCKELKNELALYAEGELSLSRCREIGAHVQSCTSCRRVLTRYDLLTQALLSGRHSWNDGRPLEGAAGGVADAGPAPGGDVDEIIASLSSARRVDETMERVLYGPRPAWLRGVRAGVEPTASGAQATASGEHLGPARAESLAERAFLALRSRTRAAAWILGGIALVLALRIGEVHRDAVPLTSNPPGRLRAHPAADGASGEEFSPGPVADLLWASQEAAPVGSALPPDDGWIELVAFEPSAAPRVRSGPSGPGVVRVRTRPASVVGRDDRVYLVPQRLVSERLVGQHFVPGGARDGSPFLQVLEVYTDPNEDRPSPSLSQREQGTATARYTVYRAISSSGFLELPCEILRKESRFPGMFPGTFFGRSEACRDGRSDVRIGAVKPPRIEVPGLEVPRRLPASWSVSKREL